MEEKKINRSIQFKNGSYSFVLTFIVIAIFVVANLAINRLPSKLTTVSTTGTDYYELSDVTKNYLKDSMNTGVTLYLLSDSVGTYDEYMLNLCRNYESASKNITFKKIDTAVNPDFAGKYSALSASSYSVIVENNETGKFKLVDYADIVSYTSATENDDTASAIYSYDGEGQLTSAISNVTNNKTVKIYQLDGHNETLISESVHSEIKTAIEKNNSELVQEGLKLGSMSSVPEDCDVLFIIAPLSDISVDELNKIKAYISEGGDVVVIYNNILPFFSEAMYSRHDNMNALLSFLGISVEEAYILEKDSAHYYSAASATPDAFLLPDRNSSSMITASAVNSKIMMCFASPMKYSSPEDHKASYTGLLSTSSSHSVVYWNDGEIYSVDYKASADLAGYISSDFGNDVKSEALVIGCSMFFEDVLGLNDASMTEGNIKMLVNSVSAMQGNEANIYVAPRQLVEKFNVISSNNATLFSIIYIGLIPLLILAAGFSVWLIRRSK